jgi:hypothetical protein
MNNQSVFSLVAEEDTRILADKSRFYGKRRQGLYPSEASVSYMDGHRKIVLGKCNRQVFYRTSGVHKTNPGGIKLHQTGRIGKELENMQVRLWKEMGIWEANNIKFFNKELVLSGELDAILKNPITNKLIGIEMKTHAEYPAKRQIHGIKKEKGSGKFLPGRPKDEHFLQACLYAWEYQDVIDEYRIFYFERDSGVRVEFKVGFQKRNDGKHQCYWQQIPGPYWNAFQEGPVLQPYTIEDIHGRYKDLVKILRKKIIPEKEFQVVWDADEVEYQYSQGNISKTNYDKWVKNPNTKSNKLGDWHCSYCDWKDQCASDG